MADEPRVRAVWVFGSVVITDQPEGPFEASNLDALNAAYEEGRRTMTTKQTTAHLRAFQRLYEHLRVGHNIAPGVLGRLRTLADLEDFHDALGCWENAS